MNPPQVSASLPSRILQQFLEELERNGALGFMSTVGLLVSTARLSTTGMSPFGELVERGAHLQAANSQATILGARSRHHQHGPQLPTKPYVSKVHIGGGHYLPT